MLSMTAEYALRAIVWIAGHDGESLITRNIASGTHVPIGYLSKVLQALSRSGLVRARRGLGGGYVLAWPADEITLLEVISAVDPVERIEQCPIGEKHAGTLCPLHRCLDSVYAHAEQTFRDTSIADVLPESSDALPLCRDGAVPV